MILYTYYGLEVRDILGDELRIVISSLYYSTEQEALSSMIEAEAKHAYGCWFLHRLYKDVEAKRKHFKDNNWTLWETYHE